MTPPECYNGSEVIRRSTITTASASTLWAEILADPRLDLAATLAHHLDALAARLQPLLPA